MKIFSVITVCAAVFCLAACKKNQINYGDIEFLGSDQALLKINNASLYPDNRLMVLKVNDQRVSNPITGRTPFPGGGYNTGGASTADFLAVPSGNVKISITVPHRVDDGTDSLELYSTTVQLTAGKNYVLHIADTAANTKSVLTEENFARPDTATARYRFVNLMPNVPAVDLYYGVSSTSPDADTLVMSNVEYLKISNDFLLKSGQASKYWKIRPAGAEKTAATVMATYTSTSTFLNQRVYTVMALGYRSNTNATQKPWVSFFLIR